MSIGPAIEHLRKKQMDSDTANVVCVVDSSGKLIDDIPIRRLVLNAPDTDPGYYGWLLRAIKFKKMQPGPGNFFCAICSYPGGRDRFDHLFYHCGSHIEGYTLVAWPIKKPL